MNLLQDLRYGPRMLASKPGGTAAAVLSLALGIGATTDVFSVYDAVLLNPLPHDNPDRLVLLWIDDPEHAVKEEGFGYPTYLDWRKRNLIFEDVAASVRDSPFEVRLGDWFDRELVNVSSANLFDVLGVTPAGPWARFQADREMDSLRGVARLKPGLSAEEVARDRDAIAEALATEHPPSQWSAGYGVDVTPLLEQLTGTTLPHAAERDVCGSRASVPHCLGELDELNPGLQRGALRRDGRPRGPWGLKLAGQAPPRCPWSQDCPPASSPPAAPPPLNPPPP